MGRTQWTTAAAVTAAAVVRLGLAWDSVVRHLDPGTVMWFSGVTTAVIASGLTTLGLLPTIQRNGAVLTETRDRLRAADIPPQTSTTGDDESGDR